MSFSQAPLGEVRRKRFCNRTKFLMIKDIQSRPTRARGLKHQVAGVAARTGHVAPHAGAWIETCFSISGLSSCAPSRPTRARGLKLEQHGLVGVAQLSRPTRARGLKLLFGDGRFCLRRSRPTRARGLKHANPKRRRSSAGVAPHAGAWIETGADGAVGGGGQVAPHAGAWIETASWPARPCPPGPSRPTRARGLKLEGHIP